MIAREQQKRRGISGPLARCSAGMQFTNSNTLLQLNIMTNTSDDCIQDPHHLSNLDTFVPINANCSPPCFPRSNDSISTRLRAREDFIQRGGEEGGTNYRSRTISQLTSPVRNHPFNPQLPSGRDGRAAARPHHDSARIQHRSIRVTKLKNSAKCASDQANPKDLGPRLNNALFVKLFCLTEFVPCELMSTPHSLNAFSTNRRQSAHNTHRHMDTRREA